MRRISLRTVLLGLAAPIGALVFAAVVCSLILLLSKHSPGDVIDSMSTSLNRPRTTVIALNNATNYYLAAVAVAIGFRMNLFNIGVDGQYRMAAMLAAALAGASFMDSLPGFLRVLLTLIAAVLVGAFWAGIAGVLKVTRGVSEVISTIMLNAIATAIISYLLNKDRLAVLTGNDIHTRNITPGGQVSGFHYSGSTTTIHGLILVAILVGVAYWFVLARTRFGFDLKATGLSESAAVASGVSVKKMVLYSMLLSGAVAGLVGMPELLGNAYSYSTNFPTGIGFVGIAVALLGRNNPIGMVFTALLWGYLDASSNGLDVSGVPKEIVSIMQGVIVFSVVIAYELVRRYRVRSEQRDVGRALGTTKVPEVVS